MRKTARARLRALREILSAVKRPSHGHHRIRRLALLDRLAREAGIR